MRWLIISTLLVLTSMTAFAQPPTATPIRKTTLFPWRRQMEQRLQRLERQIDQLQSQRQGPIIIQPYQQLPIQGQPKQQLPIPGQPQQQLPIPGQPQQQLPAPGTPQQQLPPQGQPYQQLPQTPQIGQGPQVLPINQQQLWQSPEQYSRWYALYRKR